MLNVKHRRKVRLGPRQPAGGRGGEGWEKTARTNATDGNQVLLKRIMLDANEGRKPPSSEIVVGFTIEWTLASSVGWVASFIVPLFLVVGGSGHGSPLPRDVVMAKPALTPREIITWCALGLPSGAITGLVQWLILRHRVSRAGWWVPASAIGLATAFVSIYSTPLFVIRAMSNHLLFVTAWAILGAISGVFQWLVLRSQLRRSGWWILTSVLVCIVAGELWTWIPWMVGLLGWVVVGIITGIVLYRLLSSSASQT